MAKSTAKSWEIVLNDGSLRSLVATAISSENPWVAVLFVHDGRPNSKVRYDHFIRQCEHFGASKRLELSIPHLRASAIANDNLPSQSRPPLADMQLLTAAASEAIQLSADRLVWPVQAGEDYQTISHVTETILMVEQVVRFSGYERLEIQTPLLEITDRQLIEIGHQMDVPWELARTCMTRNWDPCGRCGGCVWREKAFAEAAIEDPVATASRTQRPETLG